jgi:hypothetical protein
MGLMAHGEAPTVEEQARRNKRSISNLIQNFTAQMSTTATFPEPKMALPTESFSNVSVPWG